MRKKCAEMKILMTQISWLDLVKQLTLLYNELYNFNASLFN